MIKKILSVGFLSFLSTFIYGQYCTSSASSTTYGFIENVSFNTINQSSPNQCGQQYTDNTAISTMVAPNSTYTLAVTVSGCSGGSWTHSTKVFIDFNQNGNFTDPGEEVFAQGSHQYGVLTSPIAIPSNALTGTTRMRIVTVETSLITSVQPCGTYTWGETEDYTIEIEDPVVNNVALEEISSPQEAICSPPEIISAKIANRGRSVLSTTDINWQYRPYQGVPSSVNTYNWTGSLLQGQVSPEIILGSIVGGINPLDTVIIFTSNPNGVQDSVPEDDTIIRIVYEGFSGVFTVGGTLPDFPTVIEAANYLDSLGAICDTVIFEIRDGVYPGRFSIGNIRNAAFTRPIIFRSTSADPNLVTIIDSNSTSTANNFTIRLNGVDHISFEGIKIINSSTHPSNRMVVRVQNESQFVKFDNCIFENGFTGNSSNAALSLVYSDSSSNQGGMQFTNNTFNNGSYGIYWLGYRFNQPNVNSLIDNNLFHNQKFTAVRLANQRNLSFNNNTITSATNTPVSTSFGFDAIGLYGGFTISDNLILPEFNYPRTAIRIRDAQNTLAFRGRINNNAISLGDSSLSNSFHGIQLLNCDYIDLFHNSLAIYGTSVNSHVLRIEDGGGISILNNNFANMGAGYALVFEENNSSGFPIFRSDFNNWFTNGSNLIDNDGTNNSLQLWRSASLYDVNSISVNPLFYGRNDLHVCEALLNNAGTPINSVPLDFDGQFRSATKPDIGVDEFIPHTNYQVSDDLIICKGDSVFIDPRLNFDATVQWQDNFNGTERWIASEGSYVVSSTGNCGTATDTFTITFSTNEFLSADTNICFGDQIVLNVDPAFLAVSWDNGSIQYSRTVSQTGVYIATVKDTFNCDVTDSIRVVTSIPVSLPNDTTFCEGNTVFLVASSGTGTYSWNTGESTRTILADSSRTYVLTHTTQQGCVTQDSTRVNILKLPQALFSWTEVAGTIIFTNLSTNASSYSWNFGNGNSSTLDNPIVVYGPKGDYTVTLTVNGPCGQAFYSEQITTTIDGNPASVAEMDDFKLQVFPNPSQGIYFVNSEAKINLIQVYDVQGKLIKNYQPNNSLSNFEVNIEEHPKGMYFINVLGTMKKTIKVQKI